MARSAGVDNRTLLALLPGRLNLRRIIEDEVESLKQLIKSGNPQLIALLPGMELELRNLDDQLGVMRGLVSHFGYAEREIGRLAAVAEEISHEPSGPHEGKTLPEMGIAAVHHGKETFASTFVKACHANGGAADLKTIIRFSKGHNITSENIQTRISALRHKGLSIISEGRERWRLATPVALPDGNEGHATTDGQEEPFRAHTTPPNRRRPKKHERDRGTWSTRLKSGSLSGMGAKIRLLAALKAAPEEGMNTRQFKAANPDVASSMYLAINDLRAMGYVIDKPDMGFYKLVKMGEPLAYKNAPPHATPHKKES